MPRRNYEFPFNIVAAPPFSVYACNQCGTLIDISEKTLCCRLNLLYFSAEIQRGEDCPHSFSHRQLTIHRDQQTWTNSILFMRRHNIRFYSPEFEDDATHVIKGAVNTNGPKGIKCL